MAVTDLHVGRGLGAVLFGISEADLRKVAGDPDKAGTDAGGERWLAYNTLRCTFDFRDGRLDWIHCAHPDLVVFGRKLLGAPQSEVLEFLRGHLGDEVDVEDYDSFESHTFRESWVELQFEYRALRTVCFGYLFGDDDEPVWPVA